jgi:hypothetical protein
MVLTSFDIETYVVILYPMGVPLIYHIVKEEMKSNVEEEDSFVTKYLQDV